ncbi:hypothetical protein G6F46_009187 [Rhizopus delemar]|uniref:Uncharacterized protein n=2 Tax=Rhizopus TaxID=4842 RepID=A0A9P6YW48_9FUNG|nr:hypothetical protein G6F36_014982 [Rhizopus arrhizus]KAG1451751.1 hypothetical protein G6F55_009030 [Rhizopus delemar]KAG1492156.1 hypothetical protein G6F54_009506 [Rhizopus delemar]KAG1506366.1 hypothetical protein G6F53_009740 [Rhizopus delemar]KAG1521468.1 hypothetical protein G6F52_006720 [Rhizopus delemar]
MNHFYFFLTVLLSSCAAVIIEKHDQPILSIQYPTESDVFSLGSKLTIQWSISDNHSFLVDINAISNDDRVPIAQGLNATVENYTWTVPNELMKKANKLWTIEISYPVNQTASSGSIAIIKSTSITQSFVPTATIGRYMASYTAAASITVDGENSKTHEQSLGIALSVDPLILILSTATIALFML